eukprot:RCo036585
MKGGTPGGNPANATASRQPCSPPYLTLTGHGDPTGERREARRQGGREWKGGWGFSKVSEGVGRGHCGTAKLGLALGLALLLLLLLLHGHLLLQGHPGGGLR